MSTALNPMATAALATALVTAAAAAAAQHSGPPGPGWTYRDGAWSYSAEQRERDEIEQLKARRATLAHQLVAVRSADARAALQRFAAEPDPACQSAALLAAANTAVETSLTAIGGSGLTDRALTAGLLLDVADAAAERGCADIARPLYRYVIATYTGSGYAAHRQRAEISLAALPAGGQR